MRVLDLFSGTGSATQAFADRGHEVHHIDILNGDDISMMVPEDIGGHWDFWWLSPPCTTYSLAAISHHRPTGYQITEDAVVSDALILRCLRLIEVCKPDFWLMENPRALLRKMWFMHGIPYTTITYCQYGDTRMKPTDLFGKWPGNMLLALEELKEG